MAIEFECQCGYKNEVHETLAGKQIRCPQCGDFKIVEQELEALPVDAPAAGDSELELVDDEAMQKCPFCAEWIKGGAVKCRFCGEFLDRTPARVPMKKGPERQDKHDKQDRVIAMKRRQEILKRIVKPEAPSARVSLWLGVTGIILGVITGIPAILIGISAKREIKANPKLRGREMSTIGIVLGIISIPLTVGWVFFILHLLNTIKLTTPFGGAS
jgi:hypothetical protein